MAFYLKPAEGSISINKFHIYAEVRLRFLAGLRPGESNNNNGVHLLPPSLMQHASCLHEGDVQDRVSHFVLRSVSLLHPPLHTFVLNKERLLFSQRLQRMNYKDLESSLTILRRQLKEYQDFDEDNAKLFQGAREVLRSILKSRCLKHSNANGDCSRPFLARSSTCTSSSSSNLRKKMNSCPEHYGNLIVKVPFQHVLKFVAERQVELSGGLALLRCDQIPMYLSQLFDSLLEYSSKRMRETPCLEKIAEDPRFKDLAESLQKIYARVVPFQRTGLKGCDRLISLEQLDEYSQYFPPCMRAIHHTLRTRHRLCHHPRVQYTLYLKDIGLPIEDFLRLLQIEYSRPAVQTDPNQKHKCAHSWQADSKRYINGTRSLYGLQGARINYSSHSCRKIQGTTPGPNECGGCPFSHFDKANLKRFLNFDLGGQESADNFLKQIRSDTIQPIESCHMHLRFKLKRLVELNSQLEYPETQDVRILENSQVQTHTVLQPKHYYAVISKLVNELNK